MCIDVFLNDGKGLFSLLFSYVDYSRIALIRVNSVAWSPDGKYIPSASKDKTIRVWDVQSNTEKNLRLQVPGQIDLKHECDKKSLCWTLEGHLDW